VTEIALLRAMLLDGPAVERRPGRSGPWYRRPTLTGLTPAEPGTIADRHGYRVTFAFTEPDGRTVTYAGEISQDDLLRALLTAGLLTRREPR